MARWLQLRGLRCPNFVPSSVRDSHTSHGPPPGLLSNQGEKSINFFFHKGSFKKKVLKYGTPKPSLWDMMISNQNCLLDDGVVDLLVAGHCKHDETLVFQV